MHNTREGRFGTRNPGPAKVVQTTARSSAGWGGLGNKFDLAFQMLIGTGIEPKRVPSSVAVHRNLAGARQQQKQKLDLLRCSMNGKVHNKKSGFTIKSHGS